MRLLPIDSCSVRAGPRCHVVQFYGCEEELAGSVSGYLARALADDCVVLVVATAAHSQAFRDGMARSGVDVGAARRSGALRFADVSAAVASFTTDGVVDPAGFDATIGQLVRRAVAAGKPVHVYGEMVALLWDAGYVTATLELELLWNELGRALPFSLYCAYPQQSVSGDGDRDARAEVCSLHSAVISPPQRVPPPVLPAGERRAARSFPADRGAPRAARLFVTGALRHWHGEHYADDAALVVTELATNAVVHTGSPFTVDVAAADSAMRVSVRDEARLDGASPGGALLAAPGHGLSVVSAVAVTWGVEETADGKTVWAELRQS